MLFRSTKMVGLRLAGETSSLAIMRAVGIKDLLREVMMILVRFCGDVVVTGVIEVADSGRRQDIVPASPKTALCRKLGSAST